MNAADPRAYLASPQARTIAYLVDACAASMLLIPLAYRAYWSDVPNPGLPEFVAVYFAYHLFFLIHKDGVSPGKYMTRIAVVGVQGRPLALWQGLLRSACLCVPWLLFEVADHLPTSTILLKAMSGELGTLGVLWWIIETMLIERAVERRSMTDRIARTLVVALPPPQPHSAPAAPMFSATDAEFGNPPKRPKRK